MKSKCILIFVLMLMGTQWSAHAQRGYKKEMLVGGRGGVTFSKLRMDPSVKQNFLLGATAGVVFRYIEEKYFGFQLELNYAQHGWAENFEGDPYSYSRTTNYLEIPFMSHIFFGNQRVRGYFNVGPQIGLYLSDSYKSNFDILNPPKFTFSRHVAHLDMKVANSLDYGICGGLGFEFKAGKSSFNLEGRYYFGLADIFNNRKKDYFSASSNQNISVALMYLFNLK